MNIYGNALALVYAGCCCLLYFMKTYSCRCTISAVNQYNTNSK